MEVNEAQTSEKSKGYLCWICSAKGINYYHMHFDRDSKAGREVSKLYGGKEQKASGVPWLDAVGKGKLEMDYLVAGYPLWWVSLVAQLVKNLPANAGDTGLIPESRISSGEGNGNPFQYSYLENSMDRGAWWATEVAKSSTRLSN